MVACSSLRRVRALIYWQHKAQRQRFAHVRTLWRCVAVAQSAGALDVLHAVEDVKQRYHIDADRIVLAGCAPTHPLPGCTHRCPHRAPACTERASNAHQSAHRKAAVHVVLHRFSMGGAGSWSIGAHYPDLWAAVHPGAGFAESYEFYSGGKGEEQPKARSCQSPVGAPLWSLTFGRGRVSKSKSDRSAA